MWSFLSPNGRSRSNNSFKKFNSAFRFSFLKFMDDSATSQKPKRVLTEAQRLAFLKGREKRMANIEKNRLAKLEFMEATKTDPDPPMTTPTTAKTDADPVPVAQPEATVIPDTIEVPPIPKLKRQKVASTPSFPVIDEEKIASIVADKIISQMAPPPPPPRPRKPRTPKVKPAPPPPPAEETKSAESYNDENTDPATGNQPRRRANPNGNTNVPPFVHNFSWL